MRILRWPGALATLSAILLVLYFGWLLASFYEEVVWREGLLRTLLGSNLVLVRSHPPEVGLRAPPGLTRPEFEARYIEAVDKRLAFLRHEILDTRERYFRLLALDARKYSSNLFYLRREISDKKDHADRVEREFKSQGLRAYWYRRYVEQAEIDRENALSRGRSWLSFALVPFVVLALVRLLGDLRIALVPIGKSGDRS